MLDSQNSSVEMSSSEVANAIVKDPELRKMSPGSDEFNAAVTKLTEKSAQAPASEAKNETTNDEEPKKSSKSGLEKRFSTLTSERDEARQKAADLEARLEALEKSKPEPVQKETELVNDSYSKAKPDVADFDSYSDYQEALVDWKLEKKEFDFSQKQAQAEAVKIREQVVSSWDAKEAITKERVEGYDQLVDSDFIKSFTSKVASKEAMQYLLESENGPDLLFDLAEDEAKLNGFKGMSHVKQVAYLAKLESKFEGSESEVSQKPTVSKAPAPSKGLPRGKAVLTKDISNGVQSFGDYQEWRKQNSKKK